MLLIDVNTKTPFSIDGKAYDIDPVTLFWAIERFDQSKADADGNILQPQYEYCTELAEEFRAVGVYDCTPQAAYHIRKAVMAWMEQGKGDTGRNSNSPIGTGATSAPGPTQNGLQPQLYSPSSV